MARIEPPRTSNVSTKVSGEAVALPARRFRIPKTFSAVRHRNYRLFLSGQLISLAGTWMQNLAQGWLVYQISGSELALGIVGFASAIPALLITPFAGVISDRVSRRALLVATQTGAMILALILSALTFLDIVEVWHIVVLAAGLGIVQSFDGPARQAFVVEMVGREDLPNAIALNSMTFNMGRIVGPALGGVVLVLVGAAWCFLLNGISFLAVIAGLLMMKLPPREGATTNLAPIKQMKSALQYLGTQRHLGALLLMSLAFSLFGITYSTVLPAFVDKVLGQGAAAFANVNAMLGVGAVSGAFIVANWGDKGQRGRWLSYAILGFPIVLAVFAVNRNYHLALLLAILLGIGFMMTYTLINTLLQTQLVDEMRGRVLSLYTLTFFGFTPFGNLAIGSLSEWLGITPAMIVCALLSLVTTGVILWWIPQVRKLP